MTALPQDAERLLITADEYRQQFPEILVRIDWAKFRDEGWPVYRKQITTREELLGLRSAIGKRFGQVQPRFMKTTLMYSMRLEEVVRRVGSLSQRQQDVIRRRAEAFRQGAAPVVLDIPAYLLPDGTIFVMDGNHRCTALAVSERPFQVNLHLVQGPKNFKFRGMRFR